MHIPLQANPATLNLADKAIHLWVASLEGRGQPFDYYQQILSQDERERAQRFKFWRDQRRFVHGRGILRVLLGRYLQTAPESIDIQYTTNGKPQLRNNNLKFNLSHCQDWALYGFCWREDIGVDIECLRNVADAEGIAQRFFSPSENDTFLAAPKEKRMQQFFTIWTLKEAYIKAIGQGLSFPLNDFEIYDLEAGCPKLKVRGKPDHEDNWSFYSFIAERDCHAAVAVRGSDWNLTKFRY